VAAGGPHAGGGDGRRHSRRTRIPRRTVSGGLASLALATALVIAPPAHATTVIAKSFAELCAEADLIFAGTVSASESSWADPDKHAIQTRVTFADLTWLRGAPRATVTLRFAGGSIDGFTEEIAGMPRFAVGDQVVIFARDAESISPIVGFHQGLYRVVDGRVFDAEGQAVTMVGGAALRRHAAGATPGLGLPLTDFLDRVRGELTVERRSRP
jgi:hypothetical protein